MASRTIQLKARKLRAAVLKLIAALLIPLFAGTGVYAQEAVIPNFWDKHERFVKPDLSGVARLRFLTTTDFPPFNFIDRSKRLTGFHIDLARAICAELSLLQRCQIQALPWEELQPALEKGDGDVILAGLAITPETRNSFDFSRAYLHIPGRFAARKDSKLTEPLVKALNEKSIGVVKGSAHEQFINDIFKSKNIKVYDTRQEAAVALRGGALDSLFSDAVSLSFWLASAESQDCCAFAGGPYVSEKYFGMGMAAATRKGDDAIRNGIDYALSQINASGQFGELYLRYFPVSLY